VWVFFVIGGKNDPPRKKSLLPIPLFGGLGGYIEDFTYLSELARCPLDLAPSWPPQLIHKKYQKSAKSSYHDGLSPTPQPLTHHERRCNEAIKKARESIEYIYGLLSELFHITACPSEYNPSPLPGQKHLSWIVD